MSESESEIEYSELLKLLQTKFDIKENYSKSENKNYITVDLHPEYEGEWLGHEFHFDGNIIYLDKYGHIKSNNFGVENTVEAITEFINNCKGDLNE